MSSVNLESGRLPSEIAASYHLSAITDEREPVMFLPQGVREEDRDYRHKSNNLQKALFICSHPYLVFCTESFPCLWFLERPIIRAEGQVQSLAALKPAGP